MSTNEIPFSHYPQQPHGGVLVNQVVSADDYDAAIAKAKTLPVIRIDLEAAITIEMIATGVLSPNDGFMNEDDYHSVLSNGRLANGVVWPVPLSFAPIGERNGQVIASLAKGDEVALVDHSRTIVAVLKVEDIFAYDRNLRAEKVFGTSDRNHPGVDAIYRRMGDTALGGPLTLLNRVHWGPFEKLRLEPKDTWRLFYEEKKFRSVAGFITGANPLHRGHEYIHKNALEEIDGLLLQPLVEMAKREYVRHEYRMMAYRNVLEQYYPKGRSVLSPLRVTYIFAGPRETVLHALIMKNYGCTHALIGRDHAGIGSFYNKYASHTIFDDFKPDELGIDVRLFHEVFYCSRCANHATSQSCPHDEQYRLNISGTGIREMLRHGVLPPKEVVRPESAQVAIQGIQPKGLDATNGETVLPVAKVIESMYPFYRHYSRLGGSPRPKPLDASQLTLADLERATLDVREHAGQIYQDIHTEYAFIADHDAAMVPNWITKTRQAMAAQQQALVDDLKEKLEQASDTVSDEFMYQDKAEVQKELDAAEKWQQSLPQAPSNDERQQRLWNPFPYQRYRGADEE